MLLRKKIYTNKIHVHMYTHTYPYTHTHKYRNTFHLEISFDEFT